MTTYIKNEAGVLVPFAPAIVKREYSEGESSSGVGLSGEYRMVVRRADGSTKRDTGWFKNLILDAGLNRIGSNGVSGGIAIGTGAAPPAATQTALQTLAAWTTTLQASPSITAQAAAPYYYTSSRTYRFALGALNGNYSEVGFGWGSTALFSRALIVDGNGNPTPITVLSDEQLDVTYRLRLYPQTTDWGGTYTIGGSNYTVTGRTSAITGGIAGDTLNQAWQPVDGGSPSFASAFTGAIGAITAEPSGTSASIESTSNIVTAAYSNNSLSRSATVTWNLNSGNLAGGIRSVRFYGTGVPRTQYEFNPLIPKNNTRTFAMTISITWARRV